MRSESTSALGQPSDTKPTLGVCFAIRWARAAASRLTFGLGVFGRGLVALRLEAGIRIGKVGKLERSEDITCLLLQLLLHLQEGLSALLQIARHQSLDGWSLHLHELTPGIGVEHRIIAHLTQRLFLQAP